MKKIIVILVSVILLLFCASSVRAYSDPPFTTTGTFECEDAGLYTSYRYEWDWYQWQGIVDNPNTSALLLDEIYAEPVLADHYFQDFADLFYVEVGDYGKMTLSDGNEYWYVCTGVYDGYNNGPDIRYLDGTTATGTWVSRQCDLLCYTCDHSLNVVDGVRIVMWDRCEEPRRPSFKTFMWVEMYPQ